MSPFAVNAMVEASRQNVELGELQYRIGSEIAKLTNNDAAYVSCGAASGITLAIAACMAGTDPILSEQLPNTSGMRNRVVMHTCDRGYKCDVAIRCAGAAIVNIGDKQGASESQLRAILNDKTAAIVLVDTGHSDKIPIDRIVDLAKNRDIPVIVDAAGSVPPRETLWRYTRDYGADAVIISGGKGLRGPQSTGLVLGTNRMIEGCRYHGVPNTRIGRGMKVGKEELVGIYAAIKFFMYDETDFQRVRIRQIERVAAELSCTSGVTIRRRGASAIDILVAWAKREADYIEMAKSLLHAEPAIYVGHSSSGLIVSSDCLDEGEEEIVGAQLRRLLTEA